MLANFKQKQKKTRLAHILLSLGGLLVIGVALLLVAVDVNIYYKKRTLNAQIGDLQNKITSIEEENARIEKGITESDNEVYIEKVAREDLNLQKHGEKVVSFIMPEDQAEEGIEKGEGFWEKWLGWIGNIFN